MALQSQTRPSHASLPSVPRRALCGAPIAHEDFMMHRITLFVSSRSHLLIAILAGVIASLVIPGRALLILPGAKAHLVLSWDVGAAVFLGLWAVTMIRTPIWDMPKHAKAQQDGEWTVFALTLAGIVASIVAIIIEFHDITNLKNEARGIHLGLVITTLLVSWLMMQVVFALRYAHEFYTVSDGSGTMDGGLDFPHEPEPDYFDFLYFGMVLGMTFQVSDVEITSRKIRRLATLHGFIGFVFNTVILALTVNIAAGLL
jgi:uncharacterized membrane protein